MTTPIRAAAERILDTNIRALGRPEHYQVVQGGTFKHLDLAAYETPRQGMAAIGFMPVVDIEDLNVTEQPNSLLARTFTEYFVSMEGTTVAQFYQVKPNMATLWKQLWRGLRNGRWIATPRFFLKSCRTRNLITFSTTYQDGWHLDTTNASLVSVASTPRPASVEVEAWPRLTSSETLFARHRDRLIERAARLPGVAPIVTRGRDQAVAMFLRRRNEAKAYRESIGWVTRDQLRTLAKGNDALADAIFNEIKVLQAERQQGQTASTS